MKNMDAAIEKAQRWLIDGMPLPHAFTTRQRLGPAALTLTPIYASQFQGYECTPYSFWVFLRHTRRARHLSLVDGRTVALPPHTAFFEPHFAPFDMPTRSLLRAPLTQAIETLAPFVLRAGAVSYLSFLCNIAELDREQHAQWFLAATNLRMARAVLPLGFTLHVGGDENRVQIVARRHDLLQTMNDTKTAAVLMRLCGPQHAHLLPRALAALQGQVQASSPDFSPVHEQGIVPSMRFRYT